MQSPGNRALLFVLPLYFFLVYERASVHGVKFGFKRDGLAVGSPLVLFSANLISVHCILTPPQIVSGNNLNQKNIIYN